MKRIFNTFLILVLFAFAFATNVKAEISFFDRFDYAPFVEVMKSYLDSEPESSTVFVSAYYKEIPGSNSVEIGYKTRKENGKEVKNAWQIPADDLNKLLGLVLRVAGNADMVEQQNSDAKSFWGILVDAVYSDYSSGGNLTASGQK